MVPHLSYHPLSLLPLTSALLSVLCFTPALLFIDFKAPNNLIPYNAIPRATAAYYGNSGLILFIGFLFNSSFLC